MTPLLSVEDLRVRFATPAGGLVAVDGVGWSIEPGRSLGLVGEAGSGKSTACRAILGLTGPGSTVEGRVLFAERDLLACTASELRHVRGKDIAMTWGSRSLHPLFTVGRQVMEAIRVHRGVSESAAHDRAIDLLEMVGIPDPHERVDAHPHELAEDLRQRAAIAMAVANQPKLLICDEMVPGRDELVTQQILALLSELQSRFAMALIIIAPTSALVAEAAEQVVFMHGGRLVERPPDAVEDPAGSYSSST